jgi:hypothetical protein
MIKVNGLLHNWGLPVGLRAPIDGLLANIEQSLIADFRRLGILTCCLEARVAQWAKNTSNWLVQVFQPTRHALLHELRQ